MWLLVRAMHAPTTTQHSLFRAHDYNIPDIHTKISLLHYPFSQVATMPKYKWLPRIFWFSLLLAFLLSLTVRPAYADIAPPDQPPGANPVPDAESTNVRMVSEAVTLNVQSRPVGSAIGSARVQATFNMRNQGQDAEQMQVRFPLSFWDGSSDGFSHYPEISDLQVKVNGLSQPTRRVTTANTQNPSGPSVPWAAFPVSFPPGQDVQIQVSYTSAGVGEYPFVSFKYILETGAGWADTIGSADLNVHLPYEATPQNVILDETTGWSQTSPGAVLDGQNIRWHYDNLEPDASHNLEVSLVMPEAWQKVLVERQNVQDRPQDGEAWGRLGKAYKEISRLRRGMRSDPGGLELFQLSDEAYANAIRLLPDDSLWHYGYADLLWVHFYYTQYFTDQVDYRGLTRVLELLQRSVELDPQNQQALDLLDEISYSVPEAVQRTAQGGHILLLLTATPTAPPTATFTPALTGTATPSSTPAPTNTPAATKTALPTETAFVEASSTSATPVPVSSPEPTNPPANPARTGPCGSALMLPLSLLALWVFRKTRST
jgi:hypothetical protein